MRSGNAGSVITRVIVAYALDTALVAATVLNVGDTTALGMNLLFGTGVTLVRVGGVAVPLRRPFWMSSKASIGGAEGAKPLRVVNDNTDGSWVLASRTTCDVRVGNAEIILLQDGSAEVADPRLHAVVSTATPAHDATHRDVEFINAGLNVRLWSSSARQLPPSWQSEGADPHGDCRAYDHNCIQFNDFQDRRRISAGDACRQRDGMRFGGVAGMQQC